MLRHLRPTLVLLTGLTLVTGLAYPLAMTGIAERLFPVQAQGSLIRNPDGTLVGSALIGQSFTSARYFHGRPSATVAPDPADASKTVAAPYNAANSGGANLGPTNPALIDRVKADIAALKAENPDRPGAAGPRHHLGLGARSRRLARGRPVPGAPGREGPRRLRGCARALVSPADPGAEPRHPRRAPGQRAGPQPRTRRAYGR